MKIILFLLIFISCTQESKVTDQQVEQHCQDLNILYQKIEVISSNIANVKTTRTPEGGFYKRKIAKDCKNGFCQIVSSQESPILIYQPNHPDADKTGYVAYPNINLQEEEAQKIRWERVYSTVIEHSPVSKDFFFKDPRAKKCFDKYPNLKEALDFSEYLGRKLH
ncbi:flagellar basal body rod protein FlgC [Bacteriovorax sp. Seq25_V]|uniref:flagellar basal body rod protein FlgC n=1 Tax=Bacteriovorax sp. Seq25_V TaxID=1201288 RepID=UPI00038A015F|nr:flagellar basal-body rod protein FlgC domain protein [Bacteriovorax sp. Seq25_V]EQC45630.1 flagellar basal-body rod protein FlgC domain protein [Bacteriovorax sp. Seq25_V]